MKSILAFAFFISLSVNVLAQAPGWQWAKTSTANSYSQGNSVCVDKWGNVYVAGYFADTSITFGSITLPYTNTQTQYSNLFLVKYDELGNVIWAKKVGGGQLTYNRAQSVAVDDSGNVFITGVFGDTIVFGSTQLISNSVNRQHIFLAKYNSSGNVMWARKFGGGQGDNVRSVTTDGLGNCYITGSFQGSATCSFGSIVLTSADGGQSNSMFFTKCGPNGNVIWAQESTGWGGNVIGYSVDGDKNGNCYLTGEFAGLPSATFASQTLPANNYRGTVFVVKYNSNGAAVWAKGSGGTASGVGQSVSHDALGDVFVTGYFYSGNSNDSALKFGSISLSCGCIGCNAYNVFLVKYDSLGNELWANSESGPVYSNVGNSVFADSSGNSYITGTFATSTITFGSTTLTRVGIKNLFLAKYDPLGNAVWAENIGATWGNDAYSVAVDSAGNCFITGKFDDASIAFGSNVLTGIGFPLNQMFLAKTGSKLEGINVIEVPENNISIYPNPFNSSATIKFAFTPENAQLTIYDLCGQEIRTIKNISESKIEIARGDLANGIYFIQLTEENKIIGTQKIIVSD